MIVTGGAPGEQLCRSEPWMRFSARTILSTGGSPLEIVRGELDGIIQRLTELDGILGPLLAAHARAYEEARQIRSS